MPTRRRGHPPLIEQSPVAMMSVDAHGVATFNARARTLLGVPRSCPVAGLPLATLVRRALHGEPADEVPIDWTRDASVIRLRATVGATAGRGPRRHVVAILQPRAAPRDAAAVDGDIVDAVAHDIRARLSPVVGWAHLLDQEYPGNATVQQATAVMERAVTVSRVLLDRLVELSRLRVGRRDTTVVPFDVRPLCRSVIARSKARPAERAVTIADMQPPEPLCVDADGAVIDVAIEMLLGDVIDHTPPGGHVRVRAARARDRVELVIDGATSATAMPAGAGRAPDDGRRAAPRARRAAFAIARGLLEIERGQVETWNDESGIHTVLSLPGWPPVHGAPAPRPG